MTCRDAQNAEDFDGFRLTRGTRSPVFETGALNHYATSPRRNVEVKYGLQQLCTFAFYLLLISFRRVRKNSCMSVRHCDSSTPEEISIR